MPVNFRIDFTSTNPCQIVVKKGNRLGKFTKVTQIYWVITRITHIFKKLLEYFSGRNYPSPQLYQKNRITKVPLIIDRWQIYFQKNKSAGY